MKFKSGDTVNYRGKNGWHIVVADEESGRYHLMKEDDDRRTHTVVCTEEDIFKESKFKIEDYVNYKGFICVVTNVSSPGRWDQYRYSIKGFDNNVYFETSCQEDDLSEPVTNPVKEEVKMSKFKMGDIVMCHGDICVIQSMGNKDESGETIYRLRCLFDKPYELTSTDDHLKKLDIKDFEIGMDIVKHVSGGVTWYSYSEEDKKQKQRLDLYTINTISDKIDEYLEVNGWALESLVSITSWIEGLKTGKEN